MQPSSENYDEADHFDEIELIFCRIGLERLFEEAGVLGKLCPVSNSDLEIYADISSDYSPAFNAKGLPLVSAETVQLNAVLEDGIKLYKIKHLLMYKVSDGKPYVLDNTFSLVFQASSRSKFTLNEYFSYYSSSIRLLDSSSEGLCTLYNEGPPLKPDEAAVLALAKKDLTAINGFQLNQIRQLAVRAIDAIRSG